MTILWIAADVPDDLPGIGFLAIAKLVIAEWGERERGDKSNLAGGKPA